MGVPAFYRWLSEKYPLIIKDVVEDEPWDHNGNVIPVDCTGPNPNGTEFDNLYLDMNGIIHNCSHPNDNAASNSLTEREMMLGIFRYINRCVSEIVKPKKVLFIPLRTSWISITAPTSRLSLKMGFPKLKLRRIR
mgnify:CR=1 FL=1